jgi:hypothetical protein
MTTIAVLLLLVAAASTVAFSPQERHGRSATGNEYEIFSCGYFSVVFMVIRYCVQLFRISILIAIIILVSIHRPDLCLKDDVSETGLCLPLQVVAAQVGLIGTASLCFWTSSSARNCYLTSVTFKILDNIHRPVFYLKRLRFGDCILCPFSGGTYSDGPN